MDNTPDGPSSEGRFRAANNRSGVAKRGENRLIILHSQPEMAGDNLCVTENHSALYRIAGANTQKGYEGIGEYLHGMMSELKDSCFVHYA